MGNVITGTAGNETLYGTPGADEIYGMGGYDTVFAGGGDDQISSWEADYLDGGAGIDEVVINRTNSYVGFTLDLSNPSVSQTLVDGTTLVNIERATFYASHYDDDLIGGARVDWFYGGQGEDYLNGAGGDDWLYGGFGDDVLWGGPGYDCMYGEEGDDVLASYDADNVISGGLGVDFAIIERAASPFAFTVTLAYPQGSQELVDGTLISSIEQMSFGGGWGNDHIVGGALGDELSGNFGHDHIEGGGGNDGVNGGGGDDYLFGDDGNDEITGGSGVDELWGGSNNDYLYGDAGNDQLFGGSGEDVLTGGYDSDHMVGGAHADRFVYTATGHSTVAAPDDIADFSSAQSDRIDLSAIDANTNASGNQPFTFIGAGAFTGVAGQLHYTSSHYLEGDVNGNGTADFRILLNVASLTSGDFIL